MYFLTILRTVKLNRLYIVYALAYGLSSLVIPLGAQYLVNNLALAGIWANTISFLIIIGTIFALAQILNHSQVILVEYIQRHIYMKEIKKWKRIQSTTPKQYYFEIFSLLKAFSKSYTDFIDTALVMIFGFCTIITFHPLFIILPLVTAVVAYLIKRLYYRAIETSIIESNQKYKMYDDLRDNKEITDKHIDDYLYARDNHFAYIRKISMMISMLYGFGHFFVLAGGCYLVEIDSLSIGQLVAAEIIIAGIMQSLLKVPRSIESLYDFETSYYKLKKALKGSHEIT